MAEAAQQEMKLRYLAVLEEVHTERTATADVQYELAQAQTDLENATEEVEALREELELANEEGECAVAAVITAAGGLPKLPPHSLRAVCSSSFCHAASLPI